MCSDSDVHDCLTALLKSSRVNVPCMRRSTLAPLQCAVHAACKAMYHNRESRCVVIGNTASWLRTVRPAQEHCIVIMNIEP